MISELNLSAISPARVSTLSARGSLILSALMFSVKIFVKMSKNILLLCAAPPALVTELPEVTAFVLSQEEESETSITLTCEVEVRDWTHTFHLNVHGE